MLELKLCHVLVIKPGDEGICVFVGRVGEVLADLLPGSRFHDFTRIPKSAAHIAQHYRPGWEQLAWPPGSIQARRRIHGDRHQVTVGQVCVGSPTDHPQTFAVDLWKYRSGVGDVIVQRRLGGGRANTLRDCANYNGRGGGHGI
ncbi:hypothetical protein EGJ53_11965 [Pseudomonas fluorescens]|nr:hypothetical protein EGJ53_11965 [Pseudomonas fluorescens]